MLTKSLHTVTAATNVAKLLLHTHPQAYVSVTASWQLAADALNVLGYDVPVASAEFADDTVRKIREACGKLLTASQPSRAYKSGDLATLAAKGVL